MYFFRLGARDHAHALALGLAAEGTEGSFGFFEIVCHILTRVSISKDGLIVFLSSGAQARIF